MDKKLIFKHGGDCMRERCDHCKKWVKEGQLIIPNHIPEEYQDGSIGVCEKCVYNEKYTRDYWIDWFRSFLKKG